MLNSACMCSKHVQRENKKIAKRSVCGKTMSYSLSVTMHVWTLRSSRFVARWKEVAATLLFGHPTKAKRLETSEPSDLAGKTERERHVRLPHRPHSDKNL